MELYLKLIDVLFPVFFVIGIGFYLGKKNPEISTDLITTFAGNVGTPAMIFYTITTTGVTLSVFTEYFIYALIIIGGFSIVGIVFLLFLALGAVSGIGFFCGLFVAWSLWFNTYLRGVLMEYTGESWGKEEERSLREIIRPWES